MSIILAIDDDKLTLKILAKQLEQLDFRVFTETDGTKGLDMAQSLNPDLILLDVNMPGMDGYQVIKELRKVDITREIPVIMLSVVKDKNVIVRFMRYGIVDYIIKPYTIGMLNSKIKTAISSRHLKEVELDSKKSKNILISRSEDTVFITIKGNLSKQKFIEEARLVFNEFFFRLIADKHCAIDLRSLSDFTEDDSVVLDKLTLLFEKTEIIIIAGRHYGVIVSAVDFNENVKLFISQGDAEIYFQQKDTGTAT